ncbi:HEXXH motif-containing putative peptide modification protein [Streptomyces sp. NPDC005820]|uniref:aKG-HExxH-type peptide beta-hydroxylase n=1 Tax=Streptomyces sp. NPDC005820 TaxID=3157069 RepID=UPI00340F30E3
MKNHGKACPPLRIPERHFASLASGGGTPEAIDLLRSGERSRRLLLLREFLDATSAIDTPLGPVATGWKVLRDAARESPRHVEELVLSPQAGAWLAYVLRRLHRDAGDSTLWLDVGHFHALAVAAAVKARTDGELDVLLNDGALVLPTLGMLRFEGHPAGHSVGRATVRAGRLTLHSAEGTLPDIAASDHETAHWFPLRRLRRMSFLDDLDPYRDLDRPIAPARLDAEEVAEWRRVHDQTVALLRSRPGSGPGSLAPELVDTIVPWGRTAAKPPAVPSVRLSASTGDAFGSMVIERPTEGRALAESFVHEYQHSKLGALLHLFPVLQDDRAELYYAPWRSDPRHLTGLLHGVYAFTGVAGFWLGLIGDTTYDRDGACGYHFALRRLQTRMALRTLATRATLTLPGRRLVAGLTTTLDAWQRVPVDADCLRRARLAARMHLEEWHLRNAAGITRWPDRCVTLFAAVPTVPGTADELLAAGRYAEAREEYARNPEDLHAEAGRRVAERELGRERTRLEGDRRPG